MLDFLTRVIQPVVKIRRSEWYKAGFMFFYSFFIFATLYILKPVRSSLYLDKHGSENLFFGYFLEGALLILITWVYVQFSKRFKHKSNFFTFTTLFLTSNILIFWFCFKMDLKTGWFVLLFYGWVATYSVTVATQFWTMANDIFNPEEAKRLFGFIISGGSLGGIVGGSLTNVFAERFGTENLLLLTAVLLSAAIVISRAVWEKEKPVKETIEEPKQKERISRTLQLFSKSRYLILITAFVLIVKLVETIVDNLFNGIVENSFHSKNELTAFFGGFFAWLNAVSFFCQLFITSKVLRHLGIGVSLLLLPVGLLIGSSLLIFFPILSVAVITRIYDGGLSYSVNLLSKEILYLPIPSEVRYRIKPIIDMLFFRQSKFLASIVIFIALKLIGLRVEQLGIVVVAFIPLWIWITIQVKRDYIEAIRQLLTNRRRAERFSHEPRRSGTDVLMGLFEEKSFQNMKKLLGQTEIPVRKLSAAACLAFYSTGKDVSRVRKLVEEMVRYEALDLKVEDWTKNIEPEDPNKGTWLDNYLFDFLKKTQATEQDFEELILKHEKELMPKLEECLHDQNGSEFIIRRKAISLLKLIANQKSSDILVHSLSLTRDSGLRFDTIQALNRIKAKHNNVVVDESNIEKEIFYEVSNYESILIILEYYLENSRMIETPEKDFLLAALKAIQEESLDRIFRLLSLLYPSETIYVIYDRLSESNPDETVKAHAMELLENMLKPELFRLLRSVLDMERWELEKKESPKEIIKKFLFGEDHWLSVCAVFLIAELKLRDMFPHLQNSLLYKVPIVKEAVDIAKIKLEN